MFTRFICSIYVCPCAC